MTNIWEFLLQTLTVTIAAGLLLVIKELLRDKLSPRWQYGIWVILALRNLIPVPLGRDVFLPFSFWIERWKGIVEKGLKSVYSETYIPISLKLPFPYIGQKPMSVTDWIFSIYVAGVVFFLLRYLFTYIRLRVLLRKGCAVSDVVQETLLRVCEKYHLKTCKAITISGITSAFVCGIFRPVLVLPDKQEIDEKILLHELLHLKYRDTLQNTVWSILKALHWCNPFLWYVFRRIENDMESLCDQRVLERLEGEERREYGTILLDMANDTYARVPGTSSISNGGKNISRRIEAIVRFKKYPKGMALVSVCIGIVLACSILLSGEVDAVDSISMGDYTPIEIEELDEAMVPARLYRCETVAGALDTYAKALYHENGIYMATVSSLYKHEEMVKQMEDNTNEFLAVFRWPKGEELEYCTDENGYGVYNLQKKDENCYEASLVMYTYEVIDEEDVYGSVVIPVQITQELGSWIVEECGKREVYDHLIDDSNISAAKEWSATGKSGSVTVSLITAFKTRLDINEPDYGFRTCSLTSDLKLDAEFEHAWVYHAIKYDSHGNSLERKPNERVVMQVLGLDSLDEVKVFPEPMNGSGSSTDAYYFANESVDENWNGTVITGGGQTHGVKGADIVENDMPNVYKARIIWDGNVVEDLTLTEVGQ